MDNDNSVYDSSVKAMMGSLVLCGGIALLSVVGHFVAAVYGRASILRILNSGLTVLVMIIAFVEPFVVLRRLNTEAAVESADLVRLKRQARTVASVASLFAFAVLLMSR